MDFLTFLSKVLEFLSNVINSIAWPAVVIFIFYFGREHFASILNSLKKFKFKDYEFEFERQAQKVADKVDNSIPPQSDPSDELKNRLLSYEPRHAIIESWVLVDSAAVDALWRVTGSSTSPKSPLYLKRALVEHKILDKDQTDVYDMLRHMRNEAAHLRDLDYSREAIENYVTSALKLSSYLNSLQPDLASENDKNKFD
ncbi:Uncharacterised protein [Serratia quinivorans]|uniref:DUF4145 domain-containing protein n=1 Tax=Serratia quinivorans TaxID=137545 RepID=A0A380ASR0_9GAMM|nr:hypothetical protein [Serratia proteamaculans]RYM60040.1 hypothetical protein BSR03_16445 [Serratia proteamaculans]SUI86870.1 Uncharacterised protein [Serratia quinivorans]